MMSLLLLICFHAVYCAERAPDNTSMDQEIIPSLFDLAASKAGLAGVLYIAHSQQDFDINCPYAKTYLISQLLAKFLGIKVQQVVKNNCKCLVFQLDPVLMASIDDVFDPLDEQSPRYKLVENVMTLDASIEFIRSDALLLKE